MNKCPKCGYSLGQVDSGQGKVDEHVLQFHGLRTLYETVVADSRASETNAHGVLHEHYNDKKTHLENLDYVCSFGANRAATKYYGVLSRGKKPVEIDYFVEEQRNADERTALKHALTIWDRLLFKSGQTVALVTTNDDFVVNLKNGNASNSKNNLDDATVQKLTKSGVKFQSYSVGHSPCLAAAGVGQEALSTASSKTFGSNVKVNNAKK